MLLVVAACAACGACGAPPSPPQPPQPPQPVKPVKAPQVVAAASAPPRAPEAVRAPPLGAPHREPLPAWSKEPEASGDLYTVVEGECRGLDVSVVSDTPLVHWGSWNHINIARLTDEGIAVDDKLSTVRSASTVHRLLGSLPERLYLEADNGARWGLREVALRWTGDKWIPAFALPETMGAKDLEPYMGGAIGLRTCETGPACVPGVYMGDNAKPPPLTGDGFEVGRFASLADGTAFAIGVVCAQGSCAGQLRWWRPGGKVGYASTPSMYARGDLLVRSATEVLVMQDGFLGSFDGQRLTKQPAPGKAMTRFMPLADGAVGVVADGKLFRREASGGYTDITPPRFSGGTIEGLSTGSPWMIGDKGVVQRQVDGVWREVSLPAPARATNPKSYLTPERLVVLAKDDVLVVASYFEKHEGWLEAEKRRVLLRTKRPRETLRCEPEALGLRSWPAAARPDCTTPFVVLAQVSGTSPKNYDFPRTRELLRSRASEIRDGALLEIEESGKRWIGLVPTTLATGDALVTFYAKQVSPLHPQMVCMTPDAPRVIPLAQ
jgi:hypothetical protein